MDTDLIRERIRTLLEERTQPSPAPSPLNTTEQQIKAGYGLKPADMGTNKPSTPQLVANDEERVDERRERANDLRRRRRAKNKRIAERQEALATRPKIEVPLNLQRGTQVITSLLIKHIDEIGFLRARRMDRFMGQCAQDICADTYLALNREIALELVRGERTAEMLYAAAQWLSEQPAGVDLDRHEDVPDGAHWLMAVTANRVKSTIEAWYRKQTVPVKERDPETGEIVARRVPIDSIDRLETALANSGGVDTLIENFKAKAPVYSVGSHFPGPGKIDKDLFHVVIDSWITERGLDALYELALDEANLDVYGRLKWGDIAEALFTAAGMPEGWQMLVAKTDSKELQGRYAKRLAQRLLARLPEVIATTYDLYDNMKMDTHLKAGLQPVAIFPDTETAAQAVAKSLEILVQ